MEMYLWKQESESNKGIYRMNYTIQYFIDKFTKIPQSYWITGMYVSMESRLLHIDGRLIPCCALGHCGCRSGESTEESRALVDLFRRHDLSIICVNDGIDTQFGSTKDSSKARVLCALESMQRQTNVQRRLFYQKI